MVVVDEVDEAAAAGVVAAAEAEALAAAAAALFSFRVIFFAKSPPFPRFYLWIS